MRSTFNKDKLKQLMTHYILKELSNLTCMVLKHNGIFISSLFWLPWRSKEKKLNQYFKNFFSETADSYKTSSVA